MGGMTVRSVTDMVRGYEDKTGTADVHRHPSNWQMQS
jgi:hypothetical protein